MQIRRQEAGGPLTDRALPSVTRGPREFNPAWRNIHLTGLSSSDVSRKLTHALSGSFLEFLSYRFGYPEACFQVSVPSAKCSKSHESSNLHKPEV